MMNTDYTGADFRANQMKWDSTLEQRGPGYFNTLWEKRRLCSGSKSTTVCLRNTALLIPIFFELGLYIMYVKYPNNSVF